MSAVGDHQFGLQLLLLCFGKRIQQGIEILDRQSWYDAVADVLRQPSEVLVEQFTDLLLEQVDQAHLSGNDHSFAITVQTSDQLVILTVINVQSLIAGNHTHLR